MFSEINDRYRELHRYCPRCGSDDLEQTMVGFIFANLESAQDTNRCTCQECGWRGIVHDLISADDDYDYCA